MRSLKDDWLLDCYSDAIRLQLDPKFIRLLLNEIHRRLDDPVFRRTWFVLSGKISSGGSREARA
ncbi:sporulation histidine kinase inhibitor Sda [Paenibacillus elgii]|uniref:Sporulation histidine kinase inhibitor Sda n=3 Tax=Paenibacillus elgii TaxID=189691 RepID=A0A2T6FST3_9BACL|nr:sporulation histidine kinase inhibitor Sda [Paenibacillus elgii]